MPVGSLANSVESHGFAPPPRGGFAFFDDIRHGCTERVDESTQRGIRMSDVMRDRSDIKTVVHAPNGAGKKRRKSEKPAEQPQTIRDDQYSGSGGFPGQFSQIANPTKFPRKARFNSNQNSGLVSGPRSRYGFASEP